MNHVLVVSLRGAFLLQVTSGGPGQCQPMQPQGDPVFQCPHAEGARQYSAYSSHDLVCEKIRSAYPSVIRGINKTMPAMPSVPKGRRWSSLLEAPSQGNHGD